MDEINLIIPHQANQRIIEAALRSLDFPIERCVINLDRYGNTSTASIPIATCEAVQQGRLKPGDKVVFVGFGAGLTWGAAVVIWNAPLPATRRVMPGALSPVCTATLDDQAPDAAARCTWFGVAVTRISNG